MGPVDGLTGVILHVRPEPYAGNRGRVHVWLCGLGELEADRAAASGLSTGERARASRFRRDGDRRRYIARHAFVRNILAGVLDRAPEALEFGTGRCGKPYVVVPRGPGARGPGTLEFSLAHTGEVVGLAVASDRAVGLDLETVRPIADPLGVAAVALPPSLLAALSSGSRRDRLLAFYRMWTDKEAVTKMQGHGLDCRHARGPPRIREWTLQPFSFVDARTRILGALALERTKGSVGAGRSCPTTPSALPWPSGGAPCSRTSGSAWPAARSARSTACRSS